MADADGNIWITNYRNYKLIKYIVAEQKALILDHLLQVEPRNQLSSASDFCADSINTWIITSAKGVMQYNNRTGEVNYHQHSNRLPNSIAAGLLRAIYMSPDGTIWINTPTGFDYPASQNDPLFL